MSVTYANICILPISGYLLQKMNIAITIYAQPRQSVQVSYYHCHSDQVSGFGTILSQITQTMPIVIDFPLMAMQICNCTIMGGNLFLRLLLQLYLQIVLDTILSAYI